MVKKVSNKQRPLKTTKPKKSGASTKKSQFKPKKGRKKQLKAKKGKKQKRTTWIKELLLSVIIGCVLVYVLSMFTFAVPKVEGYGMAPLLASNDRVFVNKQGKIKRFSLIYFKVPKRSSEMSIRRVIGLPGDTISYENDQLLVNGAEVAERFLGEQQKEARENEYVLTEDFSSKGIQGTVSGRIPANKYLVLGDNRSFASDSRFYGLVDQAEITGVLTMRILPLHEMMKV